MPGKAPGLGVRPSTDQSVPEHTLTAATLPGLGSSGSHPEIGRAT